MPRIIWAGMTRPRYSIGRLLGPPRVAVLHATAGTAPGDYRWLRAGGGETPAQAVSCHYYIDKGGKISQFVKDENTAWHTGPSSWEVDGETISGSHQEVARLNWLSIGCELSNRNNGVDPYPNAQIDAAVWLFNRLMAAYAIPPEQVVRHLDIAPGRKTDPANFPWETFQRRLTAPPDAALLVIGTTPSIRLDTFLNVLRGHRAPFGDYFDTIGTRIYHLAEWLEIDPAFWLALWLHEQGIPLGSSQIGIVTHNPLNIKAYGRWPKVAMGNAEWNTYEGWQTGAMHSLLHLKELYGARGLQHVETIIPVFAPETDHNDVAAYIAAVRRDMAAMRERER